MTDQLLTLYREGIVLVGVATDAALLDQCYFCSSSLLEINRREVSTLSYHIDYPIQEDSEVITPLSLRVCQDCYRQLRIKPLNPGSVEYDTCYIDLCGNEICLSKGEYLRRKVEGSLGKHYCYNCFVKICEPESSKRWETNDCKFCSHVWPRLEVTCIEFPCKACLNFKNPVFSHNSPAGFIVIFKDGNTITITAQKQGRLCSQVCSGKYRSITEGILKCLGD